MQRRDALNGGIWGGGPDPERAGLALGQEASGLQAGRFFPSYK